MNYDAFDEIIVALSKSMHLFAEKGANINWLNSFY